MKPTKRNTTIRLSDEDRAEFEAKMAAYGYDELSAFIRFAVKKLRLPPR